MFLNDSRLSQLLEGANLTKRVRADSNSTSSYTIEVTVWKDEEIEWFKSEVRKELGYIVPLSEDIQKLRDEAETFAAKLYDSQG